MGPRAWIVLVVSVFACSGKLPHPPYAAQPTSALVEVAYPPPPAHVEILPDRPTGDAGIAAVWIDGEWSWRGKKWSWKPGRWLVPPAGASFSPWTSERSPEGTYYFAPGVWRDVHGAPVDEPKALAMAGASAAVVFDADGDLERTGKSGDGARGSRRRDGGT